MKNAIYKMSDAQYRGIKYAKGDILSEERIIEYVNSPVYGLCQEITGIIIKRRD